MISDLPTTGDRPCEEWERFHGFALGLLWLFSHPEGRHEFHRFGHCHCPDQPLPAPDVFKRLPGPCVYRASIAPLPHLSYVPRDRSVSPTSSLSLTLDLTALPPSPTSPSPTQAPLEHPYRHGHAQTSTYCLLSFPNLPTVADIIWWGFYCFSHIPVT